MTKKELMENVKFFVEQYFYNITSLGRAVDEEIKDNKSIARSLSLVCAQDSFHYLAAAVHRMPEMFDKEIVEILEPLKKIYRDCDREDRKPNDEELIAFDDMHNAVYFYLRNKMKEDK